MTALSDELGGQLPSVSGAVPGPRASALVEELSRFECPGLTARRRRREEVSGASHDPIVWSYARGANVVDSDGNVYVDMTAGFGAALLGHSHPAVVDAVREQAGRMMHALGDVYPSEQKIALEARLASMAPWPARVILGLSGADAVEAALKTAVLHTGRAGVLAFAGGYHGLSYGAVAACGYKLAFRAPFEGQLNPAVEFAPFPAREDMRESCERGVEAALASGRIGAVLVEPVQGRGGVVVPPAGFLAWLGARARAHGALLVVDEIYTGLGRTGARFRAVAEGADPDVIVLGKALGGGLPVSACLMRDGVSRGWGDPDKEAIHTSTFLGNPLACAAALASLDVLDAPDTASMIARTAALLGDSLRAALADEGVAVEGLTQVGLLLGIRLRGGVVRALSVMRAMLLRGYVVLPGGVDGAVLTLTPPATLTPAQIAGFCTALGDVLREVAP